MYKTYLKMIASRPLYDFFQWIEHIFTDFLFIPFEYLRALEDETWWGSNFINLGFLLIFLILFGYWLYKLKVFHDYDSEHVKETHR